MSSFALPLDPYKLLGVSKDAKLPEIRSAHRKLVLKCHPDKVQDAALKAIKQDEFQKVQQAYELLSDDNKRLQYDEQVKLFELRKEMGRGNPTAKSNPFEYEVKSAEPGSRPSSYGRPPPNVYSNSHPPRSHEDIMHREYLHQPKKSASYDSTTDRKRAAEEARLREDAKVRAEYFRKRDEEERDRLLRAREKEREREKRAHNEKKKSRDREKRRGTEEKRSRATGAYVEDDSDDEYSPRSSTKKSDRHKMEEEIRSREAAARAEEAAREAARSQIKEAPMDPKWNEHMDFAGKYMQAARRKGAAEESTFQHPGMRRADTYASPTSREYNLRYATHQYSDDDSPRRSSATRRTSETPPTRRDRSRSRRSPSHPREPAHIVEPASPTPRIPTLQSYNSAPPNLMRDREKPSRSKTQDYPRSQPIPPLPRAQTFQSGDRGYDRDHRSSGLKKELSASDSDSDDHYRSPHHSTSPPRRGAETRYVAEGNRAVPTTTRHRSDMHNLNESYITRDRSESPRGIPRPPLTRNPPSNEARPRTATRTTSYYTPPEAPEPIILTARPKLSREPSMSRSPKYDIPLAHKVQYAPSYGTENVIFTSNRPGPDHYERRREYDHYPSRGVYASG
jgi:curved DNA-binding protein CbpA